MMLVLFSRNLSFQCWREGRYSPNREIVQVRRKRKYTCVLVCLQHSTTETLMVSSLYSLFCLIIDSHVRAFFHSSFLPGLGSFSHSRLLQVTDGLEKWQKKKGEQSGSGRDRRQRSFRFEVSFLKFSLNPSVFACQVFLFFLFFFFYSQEKKRRKQSWKRQKQEASEYTTVLLSRTAGKHLRYLILQGVHFSV